MANFNPLFLLLVTIFTPKVLAITYTVGDTSGWTTGVDFSSWTIGKTFFVGDNLVFKYEKGKHNVLDVDVSSFAQCATPKGRQPMVTGHDVVPLTTPGIKWFICNIADHCNSGQKLVISVETPPPTPRQPSPTSPVPIQAPPTPPDAEQAPPLPSSLPPAPVPALPPPPPLPIASPPLVPSPGRNQTAPHLPIAPTPTQNIPPSESPLPSPTFGAPPPSGAAVKSAVSGHLGFLGVAVGVLAGIMI
ncbi:unnamed protein product [Citrullus colocynthis]|uniref:Phytocyanin domain-containing protein n=1 Tax=Citrullus colocynthis TaxID=252529 RepID=A0ABP0XWE2_9ROSI